MSASRLSVPFNLISAHKGFTVQKLLSPFGLGPTLSYRSKPGPSPRLLTAFCDCKDDDSLSFMSILLLIIL